MDMSFISTNQRTLALEKSILGKLGVKDTMNSITIRFYAELNDFLPSEHNQVAFRHEFPEQTSIKDLIESMGVPSAKVHLVLVNGHPVPLSKPIKGGEMVAVYPKFENIDISSL